MFDQLVSLSKKTPSQQAPTSAIDEEALAKRIIGLLIPSLNTIIENAVTSALKTHSTPATSESISQSHIAVNAPCQSQPVEIDIDMSIPAASESISQSNIARNTLYQSQPVEIDVSHQKQQDEEDDDSDSGSDEEEMEEFIQQDWSSIPNPPARAPFMTKQALDHIKALIKKPNATWTSEAQEQAMHALPVLVLHLSRWHLAF